MSKCQIKRIVLDVIEVLLMPLVNVTIFVLVHTIVSRPISNPIKPIQTHTHRVALAAARANCHREGKRGFIQTRP